MYNVYSPIRRYEKEFCLWKLIELNSISQYLRIEDISYESLTLLHSFHCKYTQRINSLSSSRYPELPMFDEHFGKSYGVLRWPWSNFYWKPRCGVSKTRPWRQTWGLIAQCLYRRLGKEMVSPRTRQALQPHHPPVAQMRKTNLPTERLRYHKCFKGSKEPPNWGREQGRNVRSGTPHAGDCVPSLSLQQHVADLTMST